MVPIEVSFHKYFFRAAKLQPSETCGRIQYNFPASPKPHTWGFGCVGFGVIGFLFCSARGMCPNP